VFDIINAGPLHRFACLGAIVSNCAADYGMGFDKNVMLTSRFGLSLIQIQLCKQNALMNYSPALGHPRWMVDKTTALDLMFMAIKYGRIRFPPKDEFEIFTKDLLSPYEEVVDHGELAHRRFVRDHHLAKGVDAFGVAESFADIPELSIGHEGIPFCLRQMIAANRMSVATKLRQGFWYNMRDETRCHRFGRG